MKNKIYLDKSHRNKYKNNFYKRLCEKVLQQNIFFKKKIKIKKPEGSLCRIRNLCLQTARGRGVYRFCRFSRIILRKMISEGNVIGYSKRSW